MLRVGTHVEALKDEEHAELRTEMREEAAHREAEIVGKPRALDALAEERDSRLASRRRHVREEDAVRGKTPRERVDEERGGARLADRDRVDPDARRAGRVAIASEALAEMREIARLAPRAPCEPQDRERRGEDPRQRVQESHHARGASVSIAAATASTGGGLPAAPTFAAWPSPCRPVSAGFEAQ